MALEVVIQVKLIILRKSCENCLSITWMGFFLSGIIRNIDPLKRVLYVLTPLSFDALQRVNTLLKGNLEIPAALLLSVSVPKVFLSLV